MAQARLVFPLVPRWAVIGVSYGTMRSLRRGAGSDVAGSRPYRPGDDVHAIDWAASARLSTARGADEFVVRERYAEEAPRVVVVCDRRPAMACYRPPLPWLDTPRALRSVVELVLTSAAAAGGFVGYLDHADGELWWRPPQGERKLLRLENARVASSEFRAPDDWLARAFEHLTLEGSSLPAGTFVFCVSDFIPAPSEDVWLAALEQRWDVVPVVVQDPTWEQSFPDVHGIVVSLRDPASGRVAPIRLTRREASARRAANEERLAVLLAGLRRLDLDPILVSSSEPSDILGAFLAWSDLRRARRSLRG
ncbi:MAG: DUF58 domain-containing protein [Thermoleophilia bacterium]|nr:DUF58 domain-containing protein [Gaiellaceae bacterium]MDW8339706.1 DUF58 domain-containing protein [Thermoleophilia bacterium]